MQKAETVLSILKQKSKQDESYGFDRLYRNFFNEDFFMRAYQKIHAKQGNMTPGTDGKTIDGFKKKHVADLIELLKGERYQPKPVRRTYIPKKNGKMVARPGSRHEVYQSVTLAVTPCFSLICEYAYTFQTVYFGKSFTVRYLRGQ